jgi:hypothetical protein
LLESFIRHHAVYGGPKLIGACLGRESHTRVPCNKAGGVVVLIADQGQAHHRYAMAQCLRQSAYPALGYQHSRMWQHQIVLDEFLQANIGRSLELFGVERRTQRDQSANWQTGQRGEDILQSLGLSLIERAKAHDDVRPFPVRKPIVFLLRGCWLIRWSADMMDVGGQIGASVSQTPARSAAPSA